MKKRKEIITETADVPVQIHPHHHPQPMSPTLTTRPHTINQTAAAALLRADLDVLLFNGHASSSSSNSQPLANKSPDWHTGLCHCYSEPGGCTFCLLAAFCPCVAYGMNYSLLVTKESCNLSACSRPCLLFAFMEVVATMEQTKENQSASRIDQVVKFSIVQSMSHISDQTTACLISNHRLEVGKAIGKYTNINSTTLCSIWCDTLWCAPCVQAQIRNEALYQRRAGNPAFQFKPSTNHCPACAICCCAEDCGCAGCVEQKT